jgi:hypothetical protein
MTAPEVLEPAKPPTRQWVTPAVECEETRPEITAYAGGNGPWAKR